MKFNTQKTADRLGTYVNQFSLRTRKIGLVIFGLIIAILCLLLVTGTIGNDNAKAVRVDNITVPMDTQPAR